MSTSAARHPVTRGLTVAAVIAAALIVLATAVGVALIALGNVAWFNAIDDALHPSDPVVRALLYSSWLLLIGVPIAIRWPDEVGVGRGGAREALHQAPLVAVTAAAAAGVTLVVLTVTGATPYSDASLFVETVLVPVTEELVFRGVVLAALVGALVLVLDRGLAIPLAILANGVTFGLGHLANLTAIDSPWVIAQAAFASVVGVICAWLALRTRSVYPAMLVHAAVNAVVVLI
jgi:membrane protease YdiL (CAAX protease family)